MELAGLTENCAPAVVSGQKLTPPRIGSIECDKVHINAM